MEKLPYGLLIFYFLFFRITENYKPASVMLDSIRTVSAGREPTALLVGGVMVLSFFWWVSTRRPKGLPPGPSPALPLLGHLHLLKRDPRDQLSAWRQKYGNIFSLYMGGRLVIVLNSYPVIREALVKFADVFSDRPHVFFTDVITKNKGKMRVVFF